MKKLLFIFLIFLIKSSYGQNLVKIGSIYKEHPYIQTIKNLFELSPKGDTVAMKSYFTDTARFYPSPDFHWDEKFMNLNQVRSNWTKIYQQWEIVSVIPVGNPEAYVYDRGPITVKSAWSISAIFKKTQKKADFLELVLDEFNRDGKITKESTYFDSSSFKEAILP